MKRLEIFAKVSFVMSCVFAIAAIIFSDNQFYFFFGAALMIVASAIWFTALSYQSNLKKTLNETSSNSAVLDNGILVYDMSKSGATQVPNELIICDRLTPEKLNVSGVSMADFTFLDWKKSKKHAYLSGIDVDNNLVMAIVVTGKSANEIENQLNEAVSECMIAINAAENIKKDQFDLPGRIKRARELIQKHGVQHSMLFKALIITLCLANDDEKMILKRDGDAPHILVRHKDKEHDDILRARGPHSIYKVGNIYDLNETILNMARDVSNWIPMIQKKKARAEQFDDGDLIVIGCKDISAIDAVLTKLNGRLWFIWPISPEHSKKLSSILRSFPECDVMRVEGQKEVENA